MTGRPQVPTVRRDCACPKSTHKHGTTGAYDKDRCRCPSCRSAVAERERRVYRLKAYGRWEAGRPSIGARRRIEALMCMGWSTPLMQPHSGITPTSLSVILRGESGRVMPGTFQRICAMYDSLSMVSPECSTRFQRQALAKTRNLARRRNYLPPLAWDDDQIDDPAAVPAVRWVNGRLVDAVPAASCVDGLAVEVAAAGGRLELTRAEQKAAALILSERGVSASVTAERLGMTERSVTRYRARERAA